MSFWMIPAGSCASAPQNCWLGRGHSGHQFDPYGVPAPSRLRSSPLDPLQRQRPLSLRRIVSYSSLFLFLLWPVRFDCSCLSPLSLRRELLIVNDHSVESPETRACVCS